MENQISFRLLIPLFLPVLFFQFASLAWPETPAQGKPTFPGKPCQISPLSDWTLQEKWVWDNVCEGENANFNEGEEDFSRRFGYTIDFGGKLDPKKLDPWPESRVLRSSFLESILLYEPYRNSIPRNGVRIVGAWFKEAIDLEDGKLSYVLALVESRLDQLVNLRGIQTAFLISFAGSRMPELNLQEATVDDINLNDVKVTDSVRMRDLETKNDIFLDYADLGFVDLAWSTVEGAVYMEGAIINGRLDLNSSQIKKGTYIKKGAHLKKMVNLGGAQIKGQLVLNGSTFEDELNMNGIKVDGPLMMRQMKDERTGEEYPANFGKVLLPVARITAGVEIESATIHGPLIMNETHVEGTLFLRSSDFKENVNLSYAKIDGLLNSAGSKFENSLMMRGTRVGRGVFLDDRFTQEGKLIRASYHQVNFREAQIGELLHLRGKNFLGEIDLFGSKVGTDLQMYRALFKGIVKMTNMEVGGTIRVQDSEFEEELDLSSALIQDSLEIKDSKLSSINLANAKIKGSFQLGSPERIHWQNGAVLDLSGTEVGTFLDEDKNQSNGEAPQDKDKNQSIGKAAQKDKRTKKEKPCQDKDVWPTKLYLHKFSYIFLSDSFSARDVSCLRQWLKKADYRPEPYESLAKGLREQGYEEKADDILYWSREEQRRNSKSPLRWVWLTVLKIVIGYGYAPQYAIGWFLGFVGLGTLVLKVSKQEIARRMLNGIAYSLDMLLPIIELHKWHYEQVNLFGWARWYFYFHQIMGYVLASFLIAGLAGLTK